MLDPGLDRRAGRAERPGRLFSGGRSAGSSPPFTGSRSRRRSTIPISRRKPWPASTGPGDDQAELYDFSFAEANLKPRGPKAGDLAVMALVGPTRSRALSESRIRPSGDFADLAAGNGAGLGVISRRTGRRPAGAGTQAREAAGARGRADLQETDRGPGRPGRRCGQRSLRPRPAQIALKMILNAHSTAVMAKLGKVVGNTMTNVSPSNLKLVGRATYLIQLHVNDTLARPGWVGTYGTRKPDLLRRGERGPLRRHRLPEGAARRTSGRRPKCRSRSSASWSRCGRSGP